MPVRLAVDAMGGDAGPRTNVAGALLALSVDPELEVCLFGDLALLEQSLKTHHLSQVYRSRLTLHPCEQVIEMDDQPSSVLRNKKQSSMHQAVKAVAESQCDACVSSGNTGALMLIGRHTLGMLPGIDRPAISTAIPSRQAPCYLMDLGANVDCQAEHLLQFAQMGSEMIRCVHGIEQPRVGLLNLGHEPIKGNVQVKQAAELLKQAPNVNYCGYLEGDQIFQGEVDLVVCDGFVGNIALKTSEGLALFLTDQIQAYFARNWYSRWVSQLARPILRQLKDQMDPVRYNGASFLGLNGCLVKSHGNASARGFSYALLRAATEARQALPQQLQKRLGQDQALD